MNNSRKEYKRHNEVPRMEKICRKRQKMTKTCDNEKMQGKSQETMENQRTVRRRRKEHDSYPVGYPFGRLLRHQHSVKPRVSRHVT
jgi:hypothetical protein